MQVYGKSVAHIESTDDAKFGPNGGFTAVLSTPSLDRDGDRLLRKEWMEPLPDRIPLDIDHGMSVADTVGSFHPYFDGDRLMMDAHFAKTAKAQEVRALVEPDPETGIRHISTVSVAFMTDKNKKDAGEPHRELLNAGLVCVPSNRDAIILATKAASALSDAFSHIPEGDVPLEVTEAVLEALKAKKPKKTDDDEDEEETKDDGMEDGSCDVDESDMSTCSEKDAPKPYGDVTYADPEEGKYPIDTVAHIRAALAYIGMARNRAALGDHLAHVEAAIHAAARAHGIDVSEPHGGKSVDEAEIKAPMTSGGGDRAMLQAAHDAIVHVAGGPGNLCIQMVTDEDPTGASDGANKSLATLLKDNADAAAERYIDAIRELSPDTKLESFEKALDEVLLSPEESPAVEEPAPAPVAAAASDDAAETDMATEQRMRSLRLSMLATQYR